MPDNAGLDEVTFDPLYAKMRSFFIDLHEAAVARDIASDNRRKPARRRLSRGIATSARFQFANFTHGLGLHTPQAAVLGADNYFPQKFELANKQVITLPGWDKPIEAFIK